MGSIRAVGVFLLNRGAVGRRYEDWKLRYEQLKEGLERARHLDEPSSRLACIVLGHQAAELDCQFTELSEELDHIEEGSRLLEKYNLPLLLLSCLGVILMVRVWGWEVFWPQPLAYVPLVILAWWIIARIRIAYHAATQMPRESVAASARNIFDGLSAFLPKRLCEEELGDALEDINERIRRGRPKWELVAKIASTIFWVLTHALLDFALKVLSLINGTGKKA